MSVKILIAILTTTYYIKTTEAIYSNTLPEIKGASYNDPCNLSLYQEFLQPLYNAYSKKEYVENITALRKYLDENPTVLESQSCFEHSHSQSSGRAEHYRYLECRVKTGDSSPTCQCSQSEPFLSEEYTQSSGRQSCKPREPSVGSPCRRVRTERFVNHLVYNKFRAYIDTAKKAGDIKGALEALKNGFEEYQKNHYLHSDYRAACFNSKSPNDESQNPDNLECSKNDRCSCVNYGSRFVFKPGAGGGHCEARENSVCFLKLRGVSGKDYTFVNVECADAGTVCRPVPIQGIADYVTLQACLQPDTGSTLNINGFCLIPALAIVLVYSLAF